MSPHAAVHPKDFGGFFFLRKVAEFLHTFNFFFEAWSLRRVFSFRGEYGVEKGSSLGTTRCPSRSLGLCSEGVAEEVPLSGPLSCC